MLHTQSGVAEQFIKDVKEEVAIIMKNPKEKTTGMVSLFTICLKAFYQIVLPVILYTEACSESGRMESLCRITYQ